jgi:hypothetical protein
MSEKQKEAVSRQRSAKDKSLIAETQRNREEKREKAERKDAKKITVGAMRRVALLHKQQLEPEITVGACRRHA